MKKWAVLSILGAAALSLAACIKGGLQKPNGAKHEKYDRSYKSTIVSTEIVSFSFEKEGKYSFDYKVMENGTAKVKAEILNAVGQGDASFTAEYTEEGTFAEVLQGMVTKYELAKDNGHSILVDGLPPCGGETLYATYQSGEQIYRANNSGKILSEEASQAIFDAFVENARAHGYEYGNDGSGEPTPEVFASETEREAAELIDAPIETAINSVLRNRRKESMEVMKSSYFEPFSEDETRYSDLNERRQKLFFQLLEAAQGFEDLEIKEEDYGTELVVDYLTISSPMEHYDPFVDCYLYPELVGNDLVVRYFDPHKDGNFCIERNSEEWEQMRRDIALLDAILARVVAKIPEDFSTYEKYYYLATVVSARVEYTLETRNRATAFGALVDGKALCEGYAKSFYLLCKRANLACYLQSGMTPSGGHAWNLIVLETGTYHVDITWSDKYETGSWEWERYFALTEEECQSSGHELRDGRPATGTSIY